jgi:hypothetical protein
MVACAAVLGLRPWAWLLLPLFIALFAFLPALLTAFGLLVALAILGMRRLRAAIALVNGVMALMVCIIFIVEAQHLPVRSGVFGESLSSISLMAQSQSSVVARLSPSGWFVSLLQNLSPRQPFAPATTLGYFGAIVGLNTLFFALCMVLGERLISAASVAEENEGGGTLAARTESKEKWLQRVCSLPVAAILYKDFRYLFRDSVLLSQLAMPALLFLVPFVLLFQKGSEVHLNEELFPFTGGMVGVILFMQTSILSLSSIGLEGRAFWQYIASPNSTSQLLWAKFLMSTTLSGGVSGILLLLAGIASRIAPPLLALMVFGVLVCAAGLCGAGVGIAAAFPRFLYENPAHRVSAWAMILGFIASVLYLFLTLALFGGAWFANSFLERPVPIGCFAFVAHCVFTLTLVAISLTVGAKRIARYEWEH